jgi:pilus assembly protein CpaB
MKQKNLLLIVIAVGCGLVAAFLTTQMNATPQPRNDLIQVPVAAKELSVNTPLTKNQLDTLVTTKAINKDALPANVILDKQLMVDKRLVRKKLAGEFFVQGDVSDKGTVELPKGHNMVAFRITQDEIVGGWAVPGAKVDVIATIRNSGEGKPVVFPLFQDMLIMAVDTNAAAPVNGVMPTVQNVSLALTPKQSLLLSAALSRGASLRFALRNQGEKDPELAKKHDYPWQPDEDELMQAFETNTFGPKKSAPDQTPSGPKFEVVELPVPIEPLPAGTKITSELISSKFTMVKIQPPAPANIVENIRDYEGKYLLKDLAASQFIPPSYLAEAMPSQPEEPKQIKPAPDTLAATPKVAPELPKPEEPVIKAPPVFWDVNVVTKNGVKKYRYEVLPSGEHQFLGLVPNEGKPSGGSSPKAAPPTETPEPESKPTRNPFVEQPAGPRV